MKQTVIKRLPPRVYLAFKYWDYRVTHPARFKARQKMRLAITDDGYSYKAFDELRAIYVHIPKCAGVAVSRTIFGNLGGGHATFDEYLSVFEPGYIFDYFKFTIVRNPWDRLVSSYFFLRSGGMTPADRDWFEKELGSFPSFSSFVKNWVSRDNIWKRHHFRPQYHYMLERHDKIHLDFVAFLENIKSDFDYIVSRIGIQCILIGSNRGQHSPYMDYYDDETRDIVARVYAEDIEMLEYNFDNSSLPKQLQSRADKRIYRLR